MKKKIIALFICILLLATILPIVSASNGDIEEKEDEEIKEIKRVANPSNKGSTFREFVRGRIDDLYVEEGYVYFHAKAVRSIGFMSDGSSVFLWRNCYFKLSISYTGFNFRGIMRPRFICGVFSGST